MDALDTVVIAGAGLAGANAAFALRENGYGGRLILVGDEAQAPYERPPLSKEYLRGEKTLDNALVRPVAEYDERGIELLAGRRATRLDVGARRLTLDDATALNYDALLIATGAAPRRLAASPALAGLHHLRDVSDADALRDASADARSIAVIGGGWIGSEVAASLTQLGGRVTLISETARPLERVLGPEVADVYRDVHAAHGVRLVQGRVSFVEGDRHVDGVRLEDGRRIAADLVVVGIGAVPRGELASGAGLEMRDGAILTDEYLRTSAPGVFAAGDVAAAWHPRFGRHLRVEHWDTAIHQGKVAAANILGAATPYGRTPYFYSDQFELGMEYRGHAPEWGKVLIRGDVARREFHAFWLADGRVIAAMNVNLWDDRAELRRLVESEERVDLARLADPAVPLARAA